MIFYTVEYLLEATLAKLFLIISGYKLKKNYQLSGRFNLGPERVNSEVQFQRQALISHSRLKETILVYLRNETSYF